MNCCCLCWCNPFLSIRRLYSAEELAIEAPVKIEAISAVAKVGIEAQKPQISRPNSSSAHSVFQKKYKIEFLGKDSIIQLLSYLDPESLKKCAQVNKKWEEYSRSRRCWAAFD